MKKVILILVSAAAAFGADDVTFRSSGELKQYAETLPGKVEDNVAVELSAIGAATSR